METKHKLLSVMILLSISGNAQVNRYMVFFKDKTGTPYSISNPQDFLSVRAIERRQLNGATIDSIDLPVNPYYIAQLKDDGVHVFFKSRWLNGVLCQMDSSLAHSMQTEEFVDHVEFVAPGEKLITGGRTRSYKGRTGSGNESTVAQLSMIGISDMHKASIYGTGVFVAILDGGFANADEIPSFKDVFDQNRFSDISYDFVTASNNVFQYDGHGTEVWSVMAGSDPGIFTGGAFGSTYALFVTEDVQSEYRIEEYNWLFAAEKADSAGVDIIQSSLGYNTFNDASMNYTAASLDGKTAVITRAAEFAAKRGIIVVVSAGNEGANNWKLVTAPADGPDILAIGNVNASGARSVTSSIGPTADGRIKPDVMAMGTFVSVIRPNGTYGTSSGTSFSAPLVSSLMAGLRQQFPDVPSQELLTAVRRTASNSTTPDNFLGYGIPNYSGAGNNLLMQYETRPFFVFPNPVSDTLNIKPRNPVDTPHLKLELLDSSGHKMESRVPAFTLQNDRYVLSMRAYAAGLYLLRVYLPDRAVTIKIIKR